MNQLCIFIICQLVICQTRHFLVETEDTDTISHSMNDYQDRTVESVCVNGETWKVECNTCLCSKGQKQCTLMDCDNMGKPEGFIHINGTDYFIDGLDWKALLKAGLAGALNGVGEHLKG